MINIDKKNNIKKDKLKYEFLIKALVRRFLKNVFFQNFLIRFGAGSLLNYFNTNKSKVKFPNHI